MAISLGGVTLSDDLIIEDDLGDPQIDAVVDTSDWGTPIVYEKERSFRALDLIGDSDRAWMSRSTLVSLKALVTVGAEYELSCEGDTYTVRFRTEELPVIEATPIIKRPNMDASDWYNNIRIKLMEV
jgi:hypothetical protein